MTGDQFAFEFSYPRPAARRSSRRSSTWPRTSRSCSRSSSLDVIHSFLVPDFSEKLDAVPGITTTLRVTPTRLGTYPVECTELCGAGHCADALDGPRGHARRPSRPGSKQPTDARRRSGQPQRPTPRSPACRAPAQRPAAGASSVHSGSAARAPPSGAQRASCRGRQGGLHRLGRLQRPATRSPPPARPAPSAPTSAPPWSRTLRSAACRSSRSSTSRSRSRTPSSPPATRPNIMPQTFAQTLTATQIQALVAFIASVTK